MNERIANDWMDEIGIHATRGFLPSCLDQRTALLVVDMQRFFASPEGHAHIPGVNYTCERTAALVAAFRESGLPVIFTRHEDRPGDEEGAMGRWWGNLLLPGDPQLEIVSTVAPLPGERVVRKNHYSAFRETGLADALRADSVRGVVVAGVQTHLCCETTARDAFMEGFDVICAVDAMNCFDEVLHVAALKTLAHGFARIALAADVVDALWFSNAMGQRGDGLPGGEERPGGDGRPDGEE